MKPGTSGSRGASSSNQRHVPLSFLHPRLLLYLPPPGHPGRGRGSLHLWSALGVVASSHEQLQKKGSRYFRRTQKHELKRTCPFQLRKGLPIFLLGRTLDPEVLFRVATFSLPWVYIYPSIVECLQGINANARFRSCCRRLGLEMGIGCT